MVVVCDIIVTGPVFMGGCQGNLSLLGKAVGPVGNVDSPEVIQKFGILKTPRRKKSPLQFALIGRDTVI